MTQVSKGEYTCTWHIWAYPHISTHIQHPRVIGHPSSNADITPSQPGIIIQNNSKWQFFTHMHSHTHSGTWTYICTCIMQTHIHGSIPVYAHLPTYVHLCLGSHTHPGLNAHTRIPTHITHIHAYITYTHMITHAHTYAYMRPTLFKPKSIKPLRDQTHHTDTHIIYQHRLWGGTTKGVRYMGVGLYDGGRVLR
jgi:hypothetical protein